MLLIFREMQRPIQNIVQDTRCDVHQTVLGIREEKEGWFHLYCPGGIACEDDGELYGVMVSRAAQQSRNNTANLSHLPLGIHRKCRDLLCFTVASAYGVLLPAETFPHVHAEDDQSRHAARAA